RRQRVRRARDRSQGTRRAPPQVICLRQSWSQLLFAHDLFGKPGRTFPDHAAREIAMNRRNILWSTVSALGAAFAASRANAATEATKSDGLKVAYHLS